MLSDFESTRKSASTGEYLDMCNKCYSTIKDDLKAEERYDLYDGDEGNLEETEDIENFDWHMSKSSVYFTT